MRPKRRLALAVLLAAAAAAIVALPFRATWWGGWLLAIAEAGIVGGLADWFAVTALFRRPLGLPIPHTALIPNNWELMARRVGTMVGDRVLTKEYVAAEIDRLDVADLLARGALRLTRDDIDAATRAIARWVGDQFPRLSGADAVARLRPALRSWRLAPALAQALDLAREQGWDRRLMTGLVCVARDALDRPEFRAAVTDVVDDLFERYRERSGFYPRLLLGFADLVGVIDRERIVSALHAGLREVARDPGHPLRRRLEAAVAGLPRRLREDDALAARVETLKAEVLESDLIEPLVQEALAEAKAALETDLAGRESNVVAWVADRLEQARARLAGEAALRGELGRWIKARAMEAVDRHHGRMAAFIENGVRALGAAGAVRLVEEHAGDDLEYIRVNGTVVGGLAGGGIYGLHWLLRLL